MSGLFNRYLTNTQGQALLPEPVPMLRAEGAPLTREQFDMAKFAFDRYLERSHLSFVPNPVEQGFLPDGSRYRVGAVGGMRIMQVWPVVPGGVEDGAVVAECGILLHYIDRYGANVFMVVGYGREDSGGWAARESKAGLCGASVYILDGKESCKSFALSSKFGGRSDASFPIEYSQGGTTFRYLGGGVGGDYTSAGKQTEEALPVIPLRVNEEVVLAVSLSKTATTHPIHIQAVADPGLSSRSVTGGALLLTSGDESISEGVDVSSKHKEVMLRTVSNNRFTAPAEQLNREMPNQSWLLYDGGELPLPRPHVMGGIKLTPTVEKDAVLHFSITDEKEVVITNEVEDISFQPYGMTFDLNVEAHEVTERNFVGYEQVVRAYSYSSDLKPTYHLWPNSNVIKDHYEQIAGKSGMTQHDGAAQSTTSAEIYYLKEATSRGGPDRTLSSFYNYGGDRVDIKFRTHLYMKDEYVSDDKDIYSRGYPMGSDLSRRYAIDDSTTWGFTEPGTWVPPGQVLTTEYISAVADKPRYTVRGRVFVNEVDTSLVHNGREIPLASGRVHLSNHLHRVEAAEIWSEAGVDMFIQHVVKFERLSEVMVCVRVITRGHAEPTYPSNAHYENQRNITIAVEKITSLAIYHKGKQVYEAVIDGKEPGFTTVGPSGIDPIFNPAEKSVVEESSGEPPPERDYAPESRVVWRIPYDSGLSQGWVTYSYNYEIRGLPPLRPDAYKVTMDTDYRKTTVYDIPENLMGLQLNDAHSSAGFHSKYQADSTILHAVANSTHISVDPLTGGAAVVSDYCKILISPSGKVTDINKVTKLPDDDLQIWCAST